MEEGWEGVPGGSWCMFHDAGTHKMPFLVPGDCLPGRRCQAVCLLCSIKVYNKQVQDLVFPQDGYPGVCNPHVTGLKYPVLVSYGRQEVCLPVGTGKTFSLAEAGAEPVPRMICSMCGRAT